MAEEQAPAPATATASDMESKVRTAMVSRVPYFKEQADSLTFEGVRRLLEKDLGLDTYALDVHKRFVKLCLQECLESANEDEGPKNSGDAAETISSVEGQSVDENEKKKEAKEPVSQDGLEESPEVGLMEEHGKSKNETESTEDDRNQNAPSEAMIKKAILKRASHFRKNSENITMVGVRRLLEEDLKLDKLALDPYKKFVSVQVNEVLTNPEVAKSAKNDKKTDVKKRIPKKSSQAEVSASSESEVEEDEVKPRRKSTPKGKTQSLSGLKKRKQSDEDVKEPKRKQAKTSIVKSKGSSEGEDGGDVSEQENSDSSAEKPVKKKEVPKPSYGRRVENLKSIIKSCAMSIPPVVYKKVKQAPENKREAALIKELEDILAKEGLSANPSEKEIKEVKKKKERAKELEGIDMSNIVSSSRRRSTFSFAPPPKPKIPVESDADSGDSEDDDDDGDDDDDDEEVEVDEEQDEEADVDGSKSEEEENDGGDSD